MIDHSSTFLDLTPDLVLDAVESIGYDCDGRLLALNSYENRVYQVGIEDDLPLIAKFYRGQRWSDAQIQEEHDFTFELAEASISVVPPMHDEHGISLHHYGGYRFALFRRCGGRALELDNPDQIYKVGELMGRLHLIGEQRSYTHRPTISVEDYAIAPVQRLREWVPRDLQAAYFSVADDLIQRVVQQFDATPVSWLRCHGDGHAANLLMREDVLHMVDLDDSRMAPAVQDVFLFLPGERPERQGMLLEFLEGYTQYRPFDARELALVEPLRALRLLHYSGWLAARWQDAAFQRAFPWFNTQHYWEGQVLSLREQIAAIEEPVLTIQGY